MSMLTIPGVPTLSEKEEMGENGGEEEEEEEGK